MARELQALGFTLDEVVDALRAHDGGTATCACVPTCEGAPVMNSQITALAFGAKCGGRGG